MKTVTLAALVCLSPFCLFAQDEDIPDVKALEAQHAAAAAAKSRAAPEKPAPAARQAAEIIPVIQPSVKKASPAPAPAAAPARRTPPPGLKPGPLKVLPKENMVITVPQVYPRRLPPGFRPGRLVVLPKEAQASGGFKVLKLHQVVKGDTLWDLSRTYYQDPFMWGRIYNANFSSVANPDRIYPRNELVIPDITELLIPYRTPVASAQGSDSEEGELYGESSRDPYGYLARPAARKVYAPEKGELAANFDIHAFSEEMPEDQKEWADNMKVVDDSWSDDGVVTAKIKSDDDFLEDSLSITGETLEISLRKEGSVRPGDYLAIYLRGGDAYDRAGNKLGLELQPAGMAEVFRVEGLVAKVRVVDSVTAISKGYVVKKK